MNLLLIFLLTSRDQSHQLHLWHGHHGSAYGHGRRSSFVRLVNLISLIDHVIPIYFSSNRKEILDIFQENIEITDIITVGSPSRIMYTQIIRGSMWNCDSGCANYRKNWLKNHLAQKHKNYSRPAFFAVKVNWQLTHRLSASPPVSIAIFAHG